MVMPCHMYYTAKCSISTFFLQHEYEDIVNWYSELSMNNPDLVKFVPSIGKSVDGRDMPAVHITASTSADTMKIYFQCQIHASEFIHGHWVQLDPPPLCTVSTIHNLM